MSDTVLVPISISPQTHVGVLVTQNPALAEVFERLGIDYCCGGQRPLAEVCAERGLSVDSVISTATQALASPVASPETDWTKAPLCDLTAHIVAVHHGYLSRALPRLAALSARAAAHHGPHAPHFVEIQAVFSHLHQAMDAHSMKEERVLFPLIDQLERTQRPGPMPVDMPIHAMMAEHDTAGDALKKLRSLASDYATPEGACNTVRALYQGLLDLERDLHLHIHKENNILFPRARALELSVR